MVSSNIHSKVAASNRRSARIECNHNSSSHHLSSRRLCITTLLIIRQITIRIYQVKRSRWINNSLRLSKSSNSRCLMRELPMDWINKFLKHSNRWNTINLSLKWIITMSQGSIIKIKEQMQVRFSRMDNLRMIIRCRNSNSTALELIRETRSTSVRWWTKSRCIRPQMHHSLQLRSSQLPRPRRPPSLGRTSNKFNKM